MTEKININTYKNLIPVYLKEAEAMFGDKTKYKFDEIRYASDKSPETIISESAMTFLERAFEVKLSPHAEVDRTKGIFQLPHEIVHLLSSIDFATEGVMNFLEEGMAVYFSQVVTERDTGDLEIIKTINSKPDYQTALELYKELIKTEPDAIIKLRKICPVIAHITKNTFVRAALQTDPGLIDKLVAEFHRQ